MSAGDFHTCATNLNDELYCWGHNEYGQIENGCTGNKKVATQINFGNGRKVKRISLRRYYLCAVIDDDELRCWGFNQSRQVGANTQYNKISSAKINIQVGRYVSQLTLSFSNTCVSLNDGI